MQVTLKVTNGSLNENLSRIAREFRIDGQRPTSVETPDGTHGVAYGTDEDGDDYAIVGFNVNGKNIYAEIEDGTFGSLQGFRIYLGTVDGKGIPDNVTRW